LTRPSQKNRERFYAEQAARLLGKMWDLGDDDRENPDFVVTEGGEKFGLEVTEVFIGPQDDAGSALKASESKTQRAVNALQREYESKANVPLIVKFVGQMDADNLATVVPALVAHDLPSKPTCYYFVHDTTVEHPARTRLRVHVTKALRPDWYSVNDRAGFVDCNPHDIIAAEIAKKGANLPRYKEAVGSDVRLLLVANRISNSGKLLLNEGERFDLYGFSVAYLFPYPEDVVILDSAGRI
jgi:hypothetical protein